MAPLSRWNVTSDGLTSHPFPHERNCIPHALKGSACNLTCRHSGGQLAGSPRSLKIIMTGDNLRTAGQAFIALVNAVHMLGRKGSLDSAMFSTATAHTMFEINARACAATTVWMMNAIKGSNSPLHSNVSNQVIGIVGMSSTDPPTQLPCLSVWGRRSRRHR